MSVTEATHTAAIKALADDPANVQKAHVLLDLTLRDPEQARRVREAIAPLPRPIPLDITHEEYNRHNLHMPDQPRSIASPGNVEALSSTLQSAADAWQPIRAIGDGYGFANTGFTRGTLIPFVGQLDRILALDRSELRQGVDPDKLVQFEAGATIDQLNAHLGTRGKALFNQPGFERLTFAGTMASGGHGSGIWTGPLSSHVLSLHMLSIDAQRRVVQFRIEPKDGITNPAKFSAKHPRIELIQDDNMFHACTCAMGCLGVIYSLVVAVRGAYNVGETRKKYAWRSVRDRLPQLLAEQGPGKRLHSIEVWINPYPMDGEVHCVLGERTETQQAPHGHRGLGIEYGGVEPLYRLLAWWMRYHPNATPGLLDAALSATQASDVVLHAPQGLSFGGPNVAPVTAASGGVPSAQIGEIADGLIAMLQQRRTQQGAFINSPLGLRFVKAAPAHMSPAYGRDTCMIEVPILEGTPQARATLRAYHDNIYTSCKGRPHWGQVNDTPADRLESLYPALSVFLESYRVLNPKGFFDNAFTEQMGFRHRVA